MTRTMVMQAALMTDLWTYLNTIKWGGSLEIQMAIGQSITLVTPVAEVRYAAALVEVARAREGGDARHADIERAPCVDVDLQPHQRRLHQRGRGHPPLLQRQRHRGGIRSRRIERGGSRRCAARSA